ncbi:MAG: AMP-binding protein [Bacteroidota bacterium]
MSTIYLENRYQISSEALKQISQAENIPYVNEVEESLAGALKFAWQWLQGNTTFEQATSGSTGSPKKISIHRDQMIASAQMTIQALGLTQSDSSLLCLSAQYIGGKMMVVRSLLSDMDLIIVRPNSSPLLYLPFLPTFASLVPLQIQKLLERKASSQLNRMKAIIIGGAPVNTLLEEQIANNLTVPVYSTYGMTETVSHIALRKLTPPNDSTYFEVLGNTQIMTDERGCLKIKGRVTQEKWLTTNDLVEIKNDYQFRWLGRYDSIINSGGVKVSPEAIEKVLELILRQKNFLGRFLVSSLPDEKLGERVVLLLEGNSFPNDLENAFLKDAAEQLSPYQVPKAIYYLPHFAETPTGKVQRDESRTLLIQLLTASDQRVEKFS